MTELAAKVTAALERSVLPSVVARGGSLRVAGVEDGVVTLEANGSPGAALPLASRAEALLRAAVPEVTGIRVIGPGGEPPSAAGGDLAERVRRVLDTEINPVIAAHRGHVVLAGADQGWVRVAWRADARDAAWPR